MITKAMQLRADARTCDPVDGPPRGISEAPDDRGRHQGDDDDDHLDAGVDLHGDRRSAARDNKRGDVVLVIIIRCEKIEEACTGNGHVSCAAALMLF